MTAIATVKDMLLSKLRAQVHASGASDEPLLQWAQRYFPHYYYLPPSSLHHDLSDTLDTLFRKRGQKIAIMAPRDSAKSTFLTFAQPLRDICEGREPYIILGAETQEQSRKYLEAIKDELETNVALYEAYPGATGKGRVWNVDGILTKNGIRIEAVSWKKKMRGRKKAQDRPTAIYLDDPEGDDAASSPTVRKKVWDWLNKAVLKAGAPNTNYVVASTNVHRECTIARLKDTPGWQVLESRAMIRYPANMHLWQQWKEILLSTWDSDKEKTARTFYKDNYEEMTEGALVLWPEREPLYDLMMMWAQDKASFESEKQNNPIDPESVEWDDTHFDYEGFWFDAWPSHKNFSIITVALDPSKGKDAKKGDYSAYAILGRHTDGTIYVEVDMARRPTPVIVQDGIRLLQQFNPHGFGVEINAFQELLEPEFERESKANAVFLPFVGIHNSVNKNVRIRRLGPFLARKNIRFRANTKTRMAVDQCRDFPNGDHDDGPDSIEMALRLAIQMHNGSLMNDTLGDRVI